MKRCFLRRKMTDSLPPPWRRFIKLCRQKDSLATCASQIPQQWICVQTPSSLLVSGCWGTHADVQCAQNVMIQYMTGNFIDIDSSDMESTEQGGGRGVQGGEALGQTQPDIVQKMDIQARAGPGNTSRPQKPSRNTCTLGRSELPHSRRPNDRTCKATKSNCRILK